MIVFNVISGVQLVLAAVIAAPIAWILSLFGFDFTAWFIPMMLGLTVPMDILYRLTQLAGDEEEGTPGNPWAPIAPRAGGHLFWIPMWVLGILLPVAFWWVDVF